MLERIDPGQLDELTARFGFRIDPADAGEYLALADSVLSVLDTLEAAEAAPVENVPASRDEGRRPKPGEDPLGAVVRWCRVTAKGAAGLLAGKRIAMKDSMAIAGVPMTCASRVLEGFVPAQDSVVAERILAAGGEIVAITNMDHLAFSGGGDSSDYGPTLCPFDLERTAGGSSSGAAAILWYDGVDASMGGDQGGSIRVPAAWSGVLGLKPTHGLVPYTGMVGIDQTFDHAGPLARRVEDVAFLLRAVAGKHESDPRQREVRTADYVAAVAAAPEDLRGVCVGIVTEGLGEAVGADPAVVAAVREAAERLAALGAAVSELSLPEHLQAGGIAFAGFVEGMTALVEGAGNGYHWPGRYATDLARALRRGLETRGDELSPQVKATLLLGAHLRRRYPGSLYAKAQNLRPWLRAGYDRALSGADVLLFPTTPGLPHHVDAGLPLSAWVLRGWGNLANTYPTDMTGHPALSIPAAEAGGLPVGVMLVGRRFDDARLLALARTYERTFGWLPDPAGLKARASVPDPFSRPTQ
jgi:amidase